MRRFHATSNVKAVVGFAELTEPSISTATHVLTRAYPRQVCFQHMAYIMDGSYFVYTFLEGGLAPHMEHCLKLVD